MQVVFIEDRFDSILDIQRTGENWIRMGRYQLSGNDRWMHDYSQSLEFILARTPIEGLSIIQSTRNSVFGVMSDMKFDDMYTSRQSDRGLGPLVEYCKRNDITIQMMTGNISEFDQKVAERLGVSIHDPSNSGGKWNGAFHSLVYQILQGSDQRKREFILRALKMPN